LEQEEIEIINVSGLKKCQIISRLSHFLFPELRFVASKHGWKNNYKKYITPLSYL